MLNSPKMKKIIIIFLTFFFLITSVFTVNNVNGYTQSSETQNSSSLGVDDILRSVDHNQIVLDIQNIIVDIGGLKEYIDANLSAFWVMEDGILTYNGKNVYFSQDLLVAGGITTTKINFPDGGLGDNVVIGETFKDGSITSDKLNADVFDSISKTFELNGVNAYYNSGNVGLGTSNPDEKLSINGNVKINGEGNGLIFADGTKQESVTYDDSNNVKLSGDQDIAGNKTFNDSIEIGNSGIRLIGISEGGGTIDDSELRDNYLMSENAIKYETEAKASTFTRNNGICGETNKAFVSSTPNNDLCVKGNASSVTTEGNTYKWSCEGTDGGFNSQCEAYKQIPGVCGTDDGGTFENPPTNLCSSGNTLNFTTSSNSYTWSCEGLNNGADASCSATKKTNLFDFTSHTFTNCGSTGRTGPSLSQCRSSYSVSWDNNTDFYNNSNGIQLWTVPEDGQYRVVAYGAQGGDGAGTGGRGAIIRGYFNLTKGEKLKILVGQQGEDYGERGTGGGGTFVTKSNNSILVIAGGGGGGTDTFSGDEDGLDASTTTSGTDSARNNGQGGTNGNGGTRTGAGGGFNTNGDGGSCGGYAFVNGGYGGSGYIDGGFGGGGVDERCGSSSSDGEGGGGGGGYSGGGAGTGSDDDGGGGGGSYNSGTSQYGYVGNTGHGKVLIQKQ